MDPAVYAVWLGFERGWREFRHALTKPDSIGFSLVTAAAAAVVLYFQRGSTVAGGEVSLAMATLPGLLGMVVALGGCLGAAGTLAVEREDGTLLRMKAVPHGMTGYLVGQVVSTSLNTLRNLIIVLVAGLCLVPDLLSAPVSGWLLLFGVLILGLLATLPWGAVIGSLVRSPNTAFALTMLPIMGLTAISGTFYPISAVPGYLQGVAQAFPIYWLGLGMRSALLPDSAVGAELGDSWRTLATVGMLGLWAAAGLLLAPVILRRMARRESGSAMAARREEAAQRVG
jgi:ABC-2 type transport system permease protein